MRKQVGNRVAYWKRIVLRSRIGKMMSVLLGLLGSYDTVISQFLSESLQAKAPRAADAIAEVHPSWPWWAWALMVLVVVLAIFAEGAYQEARETAATLAETRGERDRAIAIQPKTPTEIAAETLDQLRSVKTGTGMPFLDWLLEVEPRIRANNYDEAGSDRQSIGERHGIFKRYLHAQYVDPLSQQTVLVHRLKFLPHGEEVCRLLHLERS